MDCECWIDYLVVKLVLYILQQIKLTWYLFLHFLKIPLFVDFKTIYEKKNVTSNFIFFNILKYFLYTQLYTHRWSKNNPDSEINSKI